MTVVRIVDRALPRVLDALLQLALLAAAYYAYRLTRGAVDDSQGAAVAFENARSIIAIERATGLFVELQVQQLMESIPGASAVATAIYVNGQTTVLGGAVLYLFVVHRDRYTLVRNTLVIAMAIALVGYVMLPTAPPRFFPEWGFSDTVAMKTGVASDDETVNSLFNPYAAVPSMHVGNALLIGGALAWVSGRRWVRAVWLAYPGLMTLVVVGTANHWTLDVLLGALTAAAALAVARCRRRPSPGRPAAAGGRYGRELI